MSVEKEPTKINQNKRDQKKESRKQRLFKFLFQFCITQSHEDISFQNETSRQLSTVCNNQDVENNCMDNYIFLQQLQTGLNLIQSVSSQDKLIINQTKIKKQFLDKFPLIIRKKESLHENIQNELAYLLWAFDQGEDYQNILVDIPYEGSGIQLKHLKMIRNQNVIFNLSLYEKPHSYFSQLDSIQLQSSQKMEFNNYQFDDYNNNLDCFVINGQLNKIMINKLDRIMLIPFWKSNASIYLKGLNFQLNSQQKAQIINQILNYQDSIEKLTLLLPGIIKSNDILHILSLFQELRQLRDKRKIVYQMRQAYFKKCQFIEITFKEENEQSIINFVTHHSLQLINSNLTMDQLITFSKIVSDFDGYKTLQLLHLSQYYTVPSTDLKELIRILKKINVSSHLINELQGEESKMFGKFYFGKKDKNSHNQTQRELSYQISEQLSSYVNSPNSYLQSDRIKESFCITSFESLGSQQNDG